MHWLGLAISGAMLVAILYQIRGLDTRQLAAVWPRATGFWLLFVTYYFAPVVCEWIIFRRLWRLPLAGFAALVRKYIGNELLLGYIGEAYFYVWARNRSGIADAPFGAVKDVVILSAIAGNLVTLAMMAVAFPALAELRLGVGARAFYISALVILITSVGAMMLRRRLFSLSPAELRFIAAWHLVRILVCTALAALMWHLLLPSVPLAWWVLLASLRLLLSRLPFLPNKDIAFAGIAVFATGHDGEIVAMLAMVAGLLFATHVVLGLALAGTDLLRIGRRT